MLLNKYFIVLTAALTGLWIAPVRAQEDLLVEGEELLSEASPESEEAEATPDKKKKKKKSTTKKNKKKTSEEADTEATAEEEQLGKVAQALEKFKLVSGKANKKADYYMYMYSASWCGYCKQCMPDAVSEYKKMRRGRKVEFILICGDNSVPEAKAYLKSSKAKMPAIMFSDLRATAFQGLPGCGVPTFPAAILVDKDGKQIASAAGASKVKELLKNWKSKISD